MTARGAAPSGRPVTTTTTGSPVTILARDGTVLGFWAYIVTTLTIYDSAVASPLPAPIISIPGTNVGWNPFPLDLVNGLTVTQGGQHVFLII